MSIITNVFYAVKCDRCGELHENFDDSSFYFDKNSALEDIENDEWIEQDNKHYCPNCYIVDEETDDIQVKSPYPVTMEKLKRFLAKCLNVSVSVKETDEYFEIKFYTYKSKQLDKADEDYIRHITGDKLISIEYIYDKQYSNATCLIKIYLN